ncbi:paraquat-inducible protein A [Colwellia sp. PAMC 21821]|uniref:paraquat-inducible protein A n=1 Tax=Colwellia sp. PAMC 21821 TaxID=1816219 RepID=UPI0009C0BA3A|nr:paraquat-inducible protein A [Colwellia sp. PAMC 21821]ARD46246.1 Paraquat-inducible protein A [Colwellia sp. PAMC 21821]
MIKKHVGFFFNLVAMGLFIPGILLPMFSLNMAMTANVSGAKITNTLIDKNLSLLQTIQELWQDERLLVALLIFAFSVCIPVVKFILLTLAYIKKHTRLEVIVYNVISKIGKWSMADVFVVAIFLAVLSTNHAETATQQQMAIFGFKLDFIVSSETLSALGPGFFYFTGYCLLSLLGTAISSSSTRTKLVSTPSSVEP